VDHVVAISFTLAGQPFELSDDDVRARLASHYPGQINRYWVDIDGVRWPVKQVVACATGLSRSEFQSQSARRLLAKLGFSVGSASASTASPSAQMAPMRVPSPPELAPDVVLVSCVKSKRSSGAAARELYTSAYFGKMRNYAEGSGRPWFILSAEHGLVEPTEWLEPYDTYLPRTPRGYQAAWGQRVRQQLEAVLGDLAGTVFEVHAGAAYVNSLGPELAAADAVVVDKLHGKTIGQRLSWYLQRTRPPAPEVAEFLEPLQDCSLSMSLDEVLATGGEGLRSPGLYSWWVDVEGAADLTTGLGDDVTAGLIYLGLAGATRRGGRRSSNTLWGRIATMHLGNNHQFSTLRLTLGATLACAQGSTTIDEEQLTEWMKTHLRIVAVPVPDADVLDDLETDILAILGPPLNLRKMARTPLRRRLSELRKHYVGTTPSSGAQTTDGS